jgi:hypothetical protein
MEAICLLAVVVGLLAVAVWLGCRRRKLRLYEKDTAGSGVFVALQELVEPNVKHVIQMKEQKRRGAENGPGPGDAGGDDEALA